MDAFRLIVVDLLCVFARKIPPHKAKDALPNCGSNLCHLANGTEREYIEENDFGWGSEFQRIGELLEFPDLRKGKLLKADAYLIDARALLAAALQKMRAEPYAFVTDISRWI